MTCGIYSLIFVGLEDFQYIGQSQNIENRYTQHKSNLKNNLSNYKMQGAYEISNEYPNFKVVEECDIESLNDREVYWINKLNTINNGLNLHDKVNNLGRGMNNFNSVITNVQAKEILLYLYNNPSMLLTDISKSMGIGYSIIVGIAKAKNHIWLKDELPLEYNTVINQSRIGLWDAQHQGIKYPKIQSPLGESYEISNLSLFAREHNLNKSSLHQVLTGKRKTCSSWKLL